MHSDAFLFRPTFTICLKCILDNIPAFSKAKEKYRGVFEIQRSGDKTSSGEIGLDIRTHASPKVGQDQVKSILDGSLYLGPFLKSDCNPFSGIQVRSPVTTCPAGGYRNGESAQDHDG